MTRLALDRKPHGVRPFGPRLALARFLGAALVFTAAQLFTTVALSAPAPKVVTVPEIHIGGPARPRPPRGGPAATAAPGPKLVVLFVVDQLRAPPP